MSDDLESRIDRFLGAHDTMTVATVDEAGRPCAAAVFYAVSEDRRLVFVSDPATRHGENLSRNPQVAATIQANGQDWVCIRGVQIHGSARVASNDEGGRSAQETFAARFPFVTRAGRLRGALAKIDHWILTPVWIRLIDNRLGFGHADEWGQGR